ncbi:MAG: urease accessory protein UreF [Rikenellaceae bacterium]
MNNKALTSLLHLSDPTLPIGGYTHSYGLESYVQSGAVNDSESAREFVENSLRHNLLYNDALYVRIAWCRSAERSYEELEEFDNELTAVKSPREIRQASLKLGVRLLKIFCRKLSGEGVESLSQIAKRGGGHYPIIYGAVAQMLGLSLHDTLLSFYYNTMVCMVTNAVKLIPLGQISGQEIIFELEEKIDEMVAATIEIDEEMRGVCAVGFDIASMQHERLYSRLYMS